MSEFVDFASAVMMAAAPKTALVHRIFFIYIYIYCSDDARARDPLAEVTRGVQLIARASVRWIGAKACVRAATSYPPSRWGCTHTHKL